MKRIESNKYFIPVILFLLCFLLYGNAVWNDYAGDDFIYTKNAFILKGFSAIKDIFSKGSLYAFGPATSYIQQYRPLTMLSFMAEFSCFGLNSKISHFFNVLLFAVTGVMLYFFLKRMLRNYDITVVLASTLLFIFHPIHTEVIANVKSRDEILGLLFGLISFYGILLPEELEEIPIRSGLWSKRKLYYIISLAAFSLALFCKESALTFTVIIPLLLYFFTNLHPKNIFLKTIPYVVLAGIYLFIRSRVLQSMTFTVPIPLTDNSLMASNNELERTATGVMLLGKYIYMTFIPWPLSYEYSYNQIPIVSWANIKSILSLFICIGLIGFSIVGLRRKSIFSFLILFFFITISLSCNVIVQIAATFGERFLYTPSLAFCIALPVFLAKRLELRAKSENTFGAKNEELRAKSENKTLNSNLLALSFPALSFISCILIMYAIIVIPRNRIWKNNFTLYSSGIITAPNSARTHGFLAKAYMDTAWSSTNPEKSIKYYSLAALEYKRTIEIESYIKDTDTYENLGFCYLHEGYVDSAIPVLRTALELMPVNNGKKKSIYLNNMGLAYLQKKQYDTALPYFIMAYKIDSDNHIPLDNIAICYQSEGNYNSALYYDSVILLKAPEYIPSMVPVMAKIHNNMGLQYFRNNELNAALKEFSIALAIDSHLVPAIKNMSLVYEKQGNMEMAREYEQKAMMIER